MVTVNALTLNSHNPRPLSADNTVCGYAALCDTNHQCLTMVYVVTQDSATDMQSSSTKQLARSSSHFQTMIASKAAVPKTIWMQLRPACAGPLDEHMPVIAIPSFVKSVSNAECPSTLFFASLKPMDMQLGQVGFHMLSVL